MLLITAADVRAVYPTDRDDAAMAPFLAATEALTDARLVGKGLTTSIFKEVQRWYCGHLLFVADAGLHESLRVEDVTETFTKHKEPGLLGSRWGQQAVAFDSSGTLLGLSRLRPEAMLKLIGAPDGVEAAGDHFAFIEGATVGTIAGGTTIFVGYVEDVDFNDVSIPMVDARTLIQLVVDATAAPGASKTVTYEVYKKARGAAVGDAPTATGFSIAIGGDSQITTSGSGSVAFDEGDRFALRIGASAGAATAKHKFSAKFKLT